MNEAIVYPLIAGSVLIIIALIATVLAIRKIFKKRTLFSTPVIVTSQPFVPQTQQQHPLYSINHQTNPQFPQPPPSYNPQNVPPYGIYQPPTITHPYQTQEANAPNNLMPMPYDNNNAPYQNNKF
ncbi:hypothetical protein PVAND_006850 [Polypedilum vanderplanki]|uniref:Uncharacterized protein n=1 Tax=Polypedilum vanderplanki TaxID=319348 RepID=A0A9J6C4X1_POLVA|nr:hypothetical protein PVAND_006850 [Polypedilum vanderplanki]